MTLSSHKSYAVVQIQAERFDAGQKVDFSMLEDLIPSLIEREWDDLVTGPIKKDDEPANFLTPCVNCAITEDVLGLSFSSVGDWHDGYRSFFDYEQDMTSLKELVEPYMDAIMSAVRADMTKQEPWGGDKRTSSIMTMWSYHGYQDYDGVWDYDIDYLGVFNPGELRHLLK